MGLRNKNKNSEYSTCLNKIYNIRKGNRMEMLNNGALGWNLGNACENAMMDDDG